MPSSSMLHIRVDETLKAQASRTLEAMGLSVSEAVRVFLTRVVAEQQLPFAVKVPNAKTRAAMREADDIARNRHERFGSSDPLFDALEKTDGQ